MAQHALGEVKPASTTVALRATNNEAVAATRYPAQAIQFQALATNTGSVYICDRQTPTLTQHVLDEVPAPSSSPATRPSWVIGNPVSMAAFNVADFWILPAVSGEGVRVTVVR